MIKKQNKMAGVNSRFATISEAEILKIQLDAQRRPQEVFLRSLSEYILEFSDLAAFSQIRQFR